MKFEDTTFIIEDGVDEMVTKHGMQKHEILAHVSGYIDFHYPGAIEEYEDGSTPLEFYGPIETFIKKYKKQILEILND